LCLNSIDQGSHLASVIDTDDLVDARFSALGLKQATDSGDFRLGHLRFEFFRRVVYLRAFAGFDAGSRVVSQLCS